MTVSDLLTASRAAHAAYRQHAGRINKAGAVQDPGNEATALAAIKQAYALRTAAHLIDPTHTEAAWAGDTVSHDALMLFYQKYLA